MSRARRTALVGAALSLAAAVATPARATSPVTAPVPAKSAPATPKPPAAADEAVDDELLEFLGSVGEGADEKGEWLDFLASNDVEQVAKARGRTPARGK